jgi:hypothetical protein
MVCSSGARYRARLRKDELLRGLSGHLLFKGSGVVRPMVIGGGVVENETDEEWWAVQKGRTDQSRLRQSSTPVRAAVGMARVMASM